MKNTVLSQKKKIRLKNNLFMSEFQKTYSMNYGLRRLRL